MLERLWARNRARNPDQGKPEEGLQKVPKKDYQRYIFEDELYRLIIATEASLHNEEDPLEIAIGVMKAACKLYGADWSGILIADLHSQMFRPEIWYEVGIGPMKDTLFYEFEVTEEYSTWVQHLMDQKPLVIADIEAIRESNPKEYEAYRRLDARSIIGVPFGQHPLGFMVVRNPTRNLDHYEPLQLACFVAMMMVEQKRRLEAEQRLYQDEEPDDGRLRVRFNVLGQHSLEINGIRIREQDLKHPNRRGWVILLYLVLHRASIDLSVMARDLWPDEEDAAVKNNVRQAIFRLHTDIAFYHDAKLIDTRAGTLQLSENVRITTDAELMEMLYERAKSLVNTEERLAILKKAFELYQGRLFESGEMDMGSWMMQYSTHYSQIYVDITKELLLILGRKEDFHCVIDYATVALRKEPGIQDAYYWLVTAAEQTGSSTIKDMYLQTAGEELTEEEHQKLLRMLQFRREPQ